MSSVDVTPQVQKKLSLMFKELVSILEQNKVNYFAVGGTLLGAVRHQGFIPWDDDIDISLPRPDYDMFVKSAANFLPSYYKLETVSNSPGFPYVFSKLYDTRTTLVENHTQPHPRGIYIDIFPLDGISEDPKVQLRNVKKMRLYLKIYRRYFTTKARSRSLVRRLAHNTFLPIIKLIFSRKMILERVHKLAYLIPWDKAKYTVNYFGAWRIKEVQPKEWYEERIRLPFDDYEIWGPKDYDKVLTRLYGDYMQPPPEEKRKSHHIVQYIDLDLPYETYIKNNPSL